MKFTLSWLVAKEPWSTLNSNSFHELSFFFSSENRHNFISSSRLLVSFTMIRCSFVRFILFKFSLLPVLLHPFPEIISFYWIRIYLYVALAALLKSKCVCVKIILEWKCALVSRMFSLFFCLCRHRVSLFSSLFVTLFLLSPFSFLRLPSSVLLPSSSFLFPSLSFLLSLPLSLVYPVIKWPVLSYRIRRKKRFVVRIFVPKIEVIQIAHDKHVSKWKVSNNCCHLDGLISMVSQWNSRPIQTVNRISFLWLLKVFV